MIWLDAHLPPNVAYWIRDTLGHPALHVRDVDLRDADDEEIFLKARVNNVIMITKDRDFTDMVKTWAAAASHLALLWKHIIVRTETHFI